MSEAIGPTMNDVQYETCPKHPNVFLSVAMREVGKHLCAECARDQRTKTYARQKLESRVSTQLQLDLNA